MAILAMDFTGRMPVPRRLTGRMPVPRTGEEGLFLLRRAFAAFKRDLLVRSVRLAQAPRKASDPLPSGQQPVLCRALCQGHRG